MINTCTNLLCDFGKQELNMRSEIASPGLEAHSLHNLLRAIVHKQSGFIKIPEKGNQIKIGATLLKKRAILVKKT